MSGGNDSNNFLFENVWVKHFLNKTLEGDKWIDLENEIYEVIKKLSRLWKKSDSSSKTTSIEEF